MGQDVTRAALEGYSADKAARCPYFATSDSAAAWEIGRTHADLAIELPPVVQTSRGSRYRLRRMGGKPDHFATVTWDRKGGVTVRIDNA